MKQLLLSILLLSVLHSSAQDSLARLSSLPAPQQQKLMKRVDKRGKNERFLQTTLNYSAMSFVSGPHMDLGSPKKWYIISADIIPQFVIGGRWMPFPIHFTPRFKVRIFHNDVSAGDTSLPVRTPSFIPGATMYFPMKFMSDDDRKITYSSLSFFHHSNGQDHKEFNPNGTTNKYNGNFTTNYIEPTFHFRKRTAFTAEKDKFRCSNGSPGYIDFYGKVGAEFHFSTAYALRDSYGKTRINTQLGWVWVKNYEEHIDNVKVTDCYIKETRRLTLNGTFITGSRTRGMSDLNKRINVEANYYMRIPTSPNAAGFAAVGYYGSDPYNIYYEDNYFYFRVGLALGFFVYPGLQSRRK